jgi:hypothetical protein
MVPAHVAGRIDAGERLRQPIQERAVELPAVEALEIDLGRHQHDHAEDQGHEQAAHPVAGEDGRRARAQRQHDGRPRHHEDQRHAPAVEEAHALAQPVDAVAAGEVPAPARPGHAGVVEDQQAEGRYPQPVEIGAAVGSGNIGHGGTSEAGVASSFS